MIIGIPKEIKRHEYRVGLSPDASRSYIDHGHQVLVEAGAGIGSGYADADYVQAGAVIIATPGEVFAEAGMIIKVKEPLRSELPFLRRGQILYTYLHLAADPELARALVASGISAVAYETITRPDGSLPCLVPMSQIAGRLSVQEGAKYLEKEMGGRGILLAGVPGVAPAQVLILGAGVAGQNACLIAVGMGARVTVMDIDDRKLAAIDDHYAGRVTTIHSTASTIAEWLEKADLVIGAVLVPGASAPKLIRRHHLGRMKPGSVFVDIAIDQGGCAETSRPTTHDEPVYTIDGVIHYCVANMPGAVALTSTQALNNATLPWGLLLADRGLEQALNESLPLRSGLNIHAGSVCHEAVAKSCGLPNRPWNSQ